MKILNVSHNDLDGIGCTILSRLLFGDKAEYRNVSNLPTSEMNAMYADILEHAGEYTQIFITDLSVPPKSAEMMDQYNQEHGKVFYICDHHKSNIENKRYDMAYILSEDKTETDEPECGTSIYYDLLDVLIGEENLWYDVYDPEMSLVEHLDYIHGAGTGARIRAFVNLVRLWDTFKWEDIDNKELATEARLLNDTYSLTNQEYIYSILMGTDDNTAGVLCTHSVLPTKVTGLIGTIKSSTTTRIASGLIRGAKHMYIGVNVDQSPNYIFSKDKQSIIDAGYKPYTMMLLTGTEYAGRIRDAIEYIYSNPKLPEGWPERIDMFMVWNIDKGKFEIRVSNDDDCDFSGVDFAKYYGGGGHKKASGVTYTSLDTENIDENCKVLVEELRKYIF